MTHALEGLRVLDFSRFLPGAYVSCIAGDMGADVIRIEHPRELAKHRAMFGEDADGQAAARRRARPTYHRNKRSLLINPGHPLARPVIHALVKSADALGANHQHQIEALFRVLGAPELIDDPLFRDHRARVENYNALKGWLTDHLSNERAEDLELRLTEAGVPAAMLRDIAAIANHPHLVERGLFQEAVLPGALVR